MFKREHPVMEGDGGGFLGATILCIPHNRVPGVGKLGADLVVAPRMEGDGHQGRVGVGFQDGVGEKSLFP